MARKRAPHRTARRATGAAAARRPIPRVAPTGTFRPAGFEAQAQPSPPPADLPEDDLEEDLDPREKHMSIGDHLEELRLRLFWIVGVVVGSTMLALIFSKQLHAFLLAPFIQITGQKLLLESVIGPIEVYFKVSMVVGTAFSFPILLSILWGFVTPAVSARAGRLGYSVVLASSVLFWTGMAVAWLYLFPISLQFLFVDILPEGVSPQTTVEKYYGFLFLLHVGSGLVFQMPLLLVILGALRVVPMEFHRRTWKHAIIVIFVLAGFVTPSPDPLSQGILAGLLLALYAVALGIVWMIERARGKAAEEEERRAAQSATEPETYR